MCPKCSSKIIFKKKTKIQQNLNYTIGSNKSKYYKIKQYVCINCNYEFNIV